MSAELFIQRDISASGLFLIFACLQELNFLSSSRILFTSIQCTCQFLVLSKMLFWTIPVPFYFQNLYRCITYRSFIPNSKVNKPRSNQKNFLSFYSEGYFCQWPVGVICLCARVGLFVIILCRSVRDSFHINPIYLSVLNSIEAERLIHLRTLCTTFPSFIPNSIWKNHDQIKILSSYYPDMRA